MLAAITGGLKSTLLLADNDTARRANFQAAAMLAPFSDAA
jgi:hypothetical protein